MKEKEEYTRNLTEIYKLYIQLFRTRATVDRVAQRATGPQDNQARHQQFLKDLHEYVVEPCWNPQPLLVNSTERTAWGAWLSDKMMQWMRAVRWPTQPDQHTHQELGVTWVELSLSFAFWIGMYIPVKRKDSKGVDRLLTPTSYQTAKAMNMKLSEQAHSFSIWYKQIMDLHDHVQWPSLERGLVRSLYVLGSGHFSSGFLWKP